MRFLAMLSPLIAAGWPDFLRLLPFVIAFLVWVIGRFAGQLPQKPPQRGQFLRNDLRHNLRKKRAIRFKRKCDEFLRQAQAAREERPAQNRGQPSPIAAQARETATPSSGRPGDAQRNDCLVGLWHRSRRSVSRREESRSISRPPLRPVATEESRAKLEPLAPRESVAQHVADIAR